MRPPLQSLGSPHAGNRRESGAATLEFAIVVVLILTILFGIVNYGLILAVKQTVSQAAAEGARAAVPAGQAADVPGLATPQAGRSAGWLGGTCGSGQLACDVQTKPCDPAVPTVLCVTMTVTYDWNNTTLFPKFPFIPQPTSIQSVSVVRINASS